ncbi:MAG TPA: peptide chain release factor 3 [Acidimicrobiia bacterium]|nr:peptide chain release factor 3 [Acidimicrobiia bacterium]
MSTVAPVDVLAQTERRRTFAIISHPDAGKTTLTEKLLLYAGAIEEAGAVKARAGRQRDVTSDWMELERQRGISITSTVLQFEYRGHVLNLLDTPGHRDFSEDTYRVLSAVDAAVIVLDAAKGIEPQTLKLFQVARARGIPLLTFVNKCDRPSIGGLELVDDLERQLGISATPVTWPVGMGTDFQGVVDRRSGAIWRYERTSHGARRSAEAEDADSSLAAYGATGEAAAGELDLLEAVGADHSQKRFLAGETTPMFFGSALWNFGVRLLLDALVDLAPAPGPLTDRAGEPHPITSSFSGFVFKVQANLDPRHRDRIAYVRVASGEFERGMQVTNARTGRTFSTKYAHQVFGRERDTVDRAYPGDVIGLVNAGDLHIGDTVTTGGSFRFPPIPTFAPEHFRVGRNMDTGRYKQFRRGITQLDEEGVVQVLRHPARGEQEPILAAVGPMQYDVAVYRLENEFGASVELTPTPYVLARRTDREGAERLRGRRNVEVVSRADGTLLALFTSPYHLEAALRDLEGITLEAIVKT